jgi:hypothetical protein
MIGEYGSSACACAGNCDRASASADGGLRGDELVVTRAIQRLVKPWPV